MDYDVFISHASEDKESFVRQLAQKLEEHQILVWYDEFTLKPGNSLRQSIDLGLSKCRLGIVVLSENFFKKRWTNWELNGLVARENASENDLIIPIWLNITKDQLLEYSPPLADKVAIQAKEGLNQVVSRLLKVIKPEGSTLVIARDLLFKAGINAPLVTDDWWLDIVEYSGREYLNHEHLSFDIPLISWEPEDRGQYIAKHALQKLWQEEAEELKLTQLSKPNEILEFITSQPGLKNVCLENPGQIAFYFPQLTIKGLGGFLETLFDDLLKQKPKYKTDRLCEEIIALRHPDFGNYSVTKLADNYFTGAGGGFGPSSRQHDMIDCIIWLLSSKSDWLPRHIHKVLLEGLKKWGVWSWGNYVAWNISDYKETENSNALADAMHKAKKADGFRITKKIILDLKERITYSKIHLALPEEIDLLYNRFIGEKVIEDFISKKLEIEERHKRKRKKT